MTDVPDGPPPGPRDPADGWVQLPDGRRYWGRAGAAGVVAVAPDGSVLLQHRVSWSHFGGTWGLPGGARHIGESALAGALREAHEETGVDVARLHPRFAIRLDLGVWSYTTVAAAADSVLPVSVTDRESTELEWVPAAELETRDLHPGLAASWTRLRGLLADPDPVLVVDAANVVGSRPDGWWHDRAGAASRLMERLARLGAAGLPEEAGEAGEASGGDLPVVHRWPAIRIVLEGEARAAGDVRGVDVIRAPHDGDEVVVHEVLAAVAAGRPVTAVTADRALGQRVRDAGGEVAGPTRLLEQLDR